MVSSFKLTLETHSRLTSAFASPSKFNIVLIVNIKTENGLRLILWVCICVSIDVTLNFDDDADTNADVECEQRLER